MTDPKPRVAVAGLSCSRVRDTIAVHKYRSIRYRNAPPIPLQCPFPPGVYCVPPPVESPAPPTELRRKYDTAQDHEVSKTRRWDGLGCLDVGDWGVRNTVRRACTDVQETPTHRSSNPRSGYSDGY